MKKIVHIAYDYFELEGIPPYPSPFIPIDAIDFKYDWWIDRTNTKCFRFEKRYATRSVPAKTGLMVLTTSAGDALQHTEFWDDKADTVEKLQEQKTESFSNWKESFTAMGRNLVMKIGQKRPDLIYLGEQKDEIWGSQHVFQTNEIVQASDMYYGFPLIITNKINSVDFRWVEMKQKILYDGQEILFRLWKLIIWEEIDESRLSPDIFEHKFGG